MKKIVTDGIYIYAWTRDNLSQTIKKFNPLSEHFELY